MSSRSTVKSLRQARRMFKGLMNYHPEGTEDWREGSRYRLPPDTRLLTLPCACRGRWVSLELAFGRRELTCPSP